MTAKRFYEDESWAILYKKEKGSIVILHKHYSRDNPTYFLADSGTCYNCQRKIPTKIARLAKLIEK